MAPQTPPTFGSPRRSRGAPLFRLSVMGPRHGPPPPNVRSGPAQPCRFSIMGAPTWPPTPQRSKRPGAAVPLLYHGGPPRRSRGGPRYALCYAGRVRRAALVVVAIVVAAGCAVPTQTIDQRTSQGPTADEVWTAKTLTANGRFPTFEEKRYFQ